MPHHACSHVSRLDAPRPPYPRLSIHSHGASSRFGDLIDALRITTRREFTISDSISLIQNRDLPGSWDGARSEGGEGNVLGGEGEAGDGLPPRQPSSAANDDGYDTELQLGPDPDDRTRRMRTGYGRAGSVNQQHLERCFAGGLGGDVLAWRGQSG